MKNLKYILGEYKESLYKIARVSWYDFMIAYKDSYLGLIWVVLNPMLQIGVYWFVFGLGIRNGRPVDGIPFLPWLLAGIIPWFYISSAVLQGSNSIYAKQGIITKMRFPISIIPLNAVLVELYNHIMMLLILIFINVMLGYTLNIYAFQVIYYLLASIIFLTALAWINSSLIMITRDLQKIIQSIMRLLFYLTPILWSPDNLPKWILTILRASPFTYLTLGYRESLLYNRPFYHNLSGTIVFWAITVILIFTGANLQMKFRNKFIDLL
jgi:teichoic acid transport system permease protein